VAIVVKINALTARGATVNQKPQNLLKTNKPIGLFTIIAAL
jgi:hypothetical protein